MKDLIQDFKRFFGGEAPMVDKILMGILLISFVVLTIALPFITYHETKHPKPQPAILGGLEIPRDIKKTDSLTTLQYGEGDSACFKLIDTCKIKLECICTCKELREKGRGLGEEKSSDAKRSGARSFQFMTY
jgi:hypothetical protein